MMVVVMLLEIALLCLAGCAFLYSHHYPLTDALALALGITLISLSCSSQIAFLVGFPALSFLLEAILVLLALFTLKSRWRTLLLLWKRLTSFVPEHRLILLLLAVCWSYLALLALLLPVSNVDSIEYNLVRVLLFQEQGTLLLRHVTTQHQAVFPVGGDILAHMFLRFSTDYGVAVFSFLSYLIIGFGSYALACRYAPPRLALCATLVIVSLPKLVYQATSTKNDIVSAAAALLCMLLVHRLSERSDGRDVLLLTLILSFGIATKTTFLAFLLPFVLLAGVVLIRRHGCAIWWHMLTSNWRVAVMMTIPVLVLSQVWLFVHNHMVWGGWSGSPAFVQDRQHDDGIVGAGVNLIRYLFESVELLWLTDFASEHITGRPLSNATQWLYDKTIVPLVGDVGLGKYSFSIVWSAEEDRAWFGPLAFMVVLPALGYGLLRGPRLLRVLVLIQMSYAFLVAWQVMWMPWNSRFFSLFFALAAPCVAYLLGAMCTARQLCIIQRVTNGCAALLLIYSCAINGSKLLISERALQHPGLSGVVAESIWGQTDWGRDRLYQARKHFGDERVTVFAETVLPAARVGILAAGRTDWIYHYLLARPDIDFMVVAPDTAMAMTGVGGDNEPLDYLLCLSKVNECQSLVEHGYATVEQEYTRRPTVLLRRTPALE